MIYAYAHLNITNGEAMMAYRDKAGGAVEKHGGKVLVATQTASVLDGEPDLPNVAVIISFPDENAARAWINDPELADVHALRRKGSTSNITLLS